VNSALRDAERQAAASREEVRRAAAPTVDIPETPFRPYQPKPRPVPKPYIPRYVQPPFRPTVFRPTPSPFGQRDGGTE